MPQQFPETPDFETGTGQLSYIFGNTSQGEFLADNASRSLGSFVQNTSFSFYVFLFNTNTSYSVYIPANGVQVTGSGIWAENKLFSAVQVGVPPGAYYTVGNPSISLPVDILPQTGCFVKITIDTSVVGNKSVNLNITSNDRNNPVFNYNFFFTVNVPSPSYPDISVLQNQNNIQQQSSVFLGKFAQESVVPSSFEIYNYAIPVLVIPQNGISVTSIQGNETVVSNPASSSSISLSFNANETLTVNLDTSSIGQKSFVVVITSNDPDENPFIFTVVYEIAKPFDLHVKQSGLDFTYGETVSLGSFEQKSIINKSITLENSGISYGIRVTGILANGNVTFSGLPSLPFILEPNKANFAQFTAKFDSSVIGKRNASIKIQWEVSA